MSQSLKTVCLASALLLGSAGQGSAQYNDPGSSRNQTTSTRSSSRGTRGIIKLGIFGAIVVGGWAIRKAKGE